MKFDATKAIIDFYEETGEDEVSERARGELENAQAELESSNARADWFDSLIRQSHEFLLNSGQSKRASLLWTAYSTPPQFDKDGI